MEHYLFKSTNQDLIKLHQFSLKIQLPEAVSHLQFDTRFLINTNFLFWFKGTPIVLKWSTEFEFPNLKKNLNLNFSNFYFFWNFEALLASCKY